MISPPNLVLGLGWWEDALLTSIASLNVGNGNAVLLASIAAMCAHFDGLRGIYPAAVFLQPVEVFVIIACASALAKNVF